MQDFEVREKELLRQEIQVSLDNERTALERNIAGQFATPPELARDIMRAAIARHATDSINFLEPACGSGSFISSLYLESQNKTVVSVEGYEIDQRFSDTAQRLWKGLGAIIHHDDFLQATPSKLASLVVANPPYSRHHHLDADRKRRYKHKAKAASGIDINGLSGLYVYFILSTHAWLAPGAVSAWLIPSEFLDVNFGVALKEYLLENVALTHIHRFEPEHVHFSDATVTSSVVIFENRNRRPNDKVKFSTGGLLHNPVKEHHIQIGELDPEEKWSPIFHGRRRQETKDVPRLGRYFTIRRGIATGNNKFFIRAREELKQLGIRKEHVTPILPSSRYVQQSVVDADDQGFPLGVPQLGLINTSLNPAQLSMADPSLKKVLEAADEKVRGGYIVRNRTPWYKQERREVAPFLLTYMGRSSNSRDKSLRFILNKSQAIATNGYLMLYPKGDLEVALKNNAVTLEDIHEVLNSISNQDMSDGGRVYGGGLQKMEPKELASLEVVALSELLSEKGKATVTETIL
ncbi:Eco57I restriction-modification methylase domain-containing protein [Corynebacterium cystitidis]|uniref:Eco57I restriction-modification methylase domain-containing protein n=1 Tax=Corynebacterium cystitidis TaxID=35757 RepID=UPI00211F2A29|nr:N-6 DNA methylase [Corynebacterium cystitidis]